MLVTVILVYLEALLCRLFIPEVLWYYMTSFRPMTIHRLRLSCNYTIYFQCIQLSNHFQCGIAVGWKVANVWHVNQNLVQNIQALKVCFLKYASSANPFDDTFEEFFWAENLKLCFPCVDHKTEVLTDKCVMYIVMKMR